MKNLLLLVAMLLTGLHSYSQINLETSYPTMILGVVKLQWSGYKYAVIDTQINLYNMDHSVFRQIQIPSQGSNSYKIQYITEGLFNTDSTDIEYMVVVSDNAFYTKIYDEAGNELFSQNGATPFYSLPAGGAPTPVHSPIINTDNGTKMLLTEGGFFQDPVTYVYDLPGSLECLTCVTDLGTGMANIYSHAGFLSASPNPAVQYIDIDYMLPEGTQTGEIIFYNIQGNELKRYKVNRTFSKLHISVNELPTGTYLYSLEAQGINNAVKKLVVTH